MKNCETLVYILKERDCSLVPLTVVVLSISLQKDENLVLKK